MVQAVLAGGPGAWPAPAPAAAGSSAPYSELHGAALTELAAMAAQALKGR